MLGMNRVVSAEQGILDIAQQPYCAMKAVRLMPFRNCTRFFGIVYLPVRSHDTSMSAGLAHRLSLIGNQEWN
jgi:hypothetical protein